ncbi:unnamed protein product [Brucella canis str. Oliveri]|uniref:Uncharacterized protein n=1 Tax=Brucella canis (strain ATCC 23365 / NCTC 10854 / RM-666) TaxID=483179 RepID=A9MA36_BRUC2|nr:Hypothetical protein, conserved [Brucella canis ATCC 23365]CDL76065.1 unnamed protein product [Brucella canis str. Oliveri]
MIATVIGLKAALLQRDAVSQGEGNLPQEGLEG